MSVSPDQSGITVPVAVDKPPVADSKGDVEHVEVTHPPPVPGNAHVYNPNHGEEDTDFQARILDLLHLLCVNRLILLPMADTRRFLRQRSW
jgi:hypothetical protein